MNSHIPIKTGFACLQASQYRTVAHCCKYAGKASLKAAGEKQTVVQMLRRSTNSNLTLKCYSLNLQQLIGKP